MAQRTVPKLAILVFLMIALVLTGLLMRRSGSSRKGGKESGTTQEATASNTPAEGSLMSGEAPQSALPQPPAEEVPMPGCWQNLLALDQAATLEDMRMALSAAASSGDNLLVTYLQEKLAELVGDNPNAALEVISWAEKATSPGLYLEALKGTGAIQNPKVSEKLLALGESPKSSVELRRAVLEALETQKRLGADGIRRMKAIAMDENADEVAWMATRTLGRIMKEDFERTGNFEPYFKELLDVGKNSSEAAVRLLALEMPSYSNPLVSGSSLDTLGNIMQKDPDRHVREMAAFRLGVTKEPDKALDEYRSAFPNEQDLCVRWAMFRFAVRAAGAAALPLLQQWAAIEPRLQPDYEDFKKLYATGTTDFSRIWLEKQERIQCLDEDEGVQ